MIVAQAYVSGLGLGASLIMAIGAQNAHVLRTGISGQHVGLTVAVCVVVDALLIGLGIGGMGALIQTAPLLLLVARWGGAAFLIWYGLRSWLALLRSDALQVGASATAIGARQAVFSVLALSLLNPHVYLDTVVLLGAVGGSYPAPQRASFGAGAMTASLLWFTALGWGARRLSGWLRRPLAWKCLEALTGATMLALAAGLILQK